MHPSSFLGRGRSVHGEHKSKPSNETHDLTFSALSRWNSDGTSCLPHLCPRPLLSTHERCRARQEYDICNSYHFLAGIPRRTSPPSFVSGASMRTQEPYPPLLTPWASRDISCKHGRLLYSSSSLPFPDSISLLDPAFRITPASIYGQTFSRPSAARSGLRRPGLPPSCVA